MSLTAWGTFRRVRSVVGNDRHCREPFRARRGRDSVRRVQLVRDRLTWVMYVQLALWVYFLYGFGPVAPLLRDELHISRTLAGLHGTAFAAGGVIGGAVLPLFTRRLG